MSADTDTPEVPRTIRPVGSKILVRQDPENETTAGGLIMPQGVRDRWNNYATVLAVGPGTTMAGGWVSHPDVQVGDRVLFVRKAGTALIPDSREGGPDEFKDLLMLDEDDIVGVVTLTGWSADPGGNASHGHRSGRCQVSAKSDGIPEENYLPPELASHIITRDGQAKTLHNEPMGTGTHDVDELSPAVRELLVMLAEECGEVVQRCTKILRFGLRVNPYTGIHNATTLEQELGDVSAISELLERYGVVELDRVQLHADGKIEALSLGDGRMRHARVNPE